MSIRIRVVDGVTVALCAARSMAKDGDVYLDDAQHQALTAKFDADFAEMGLMTATDFNDGSAAIRAREESNNPARAWWDSVYGHLVADDDGMACP